MMARREEPDDATCRGRSPAFLPAIGRAPPPPAPAASLDFDGSICHGSPRARPTVSWTRLMDFDVELMRDLLLALEHREVSPRTTVIVDVQEMAEHLERPPTDVDEGLNTLLSLGYIDGPGADSPGMWFFRKLTRKGIQFVQATRSPRDWERMKSYFDVPSSESRS